MVALLYSFECDTATIVVDEYFILVDADVLANVSEHKICAML